MKTKHDQLLERLHQGFARNARTEATGIFVNENVTDTQEMMTLLRLMHSYEEHKKRKEKDRI